MKMDRVWVGEVGVAGALDATAIGEAVQNGSLSREEVMQGVRERLSAAQVLNATVCTDFEAAAKAHIAEGPFTGVPMFIKDLMHAKGFPTYHGSPGIPHRIEKKSDPVVKQIESTGCVVVGKSTTSEFGFLPSTETVRHGATLNPINIAYSTGGSSGGAAALVAAGVVPIAHAMDGGGSIRIPANCCGLVGLKPTRGRHVVSPTAILPIDIVTNGIVSRTVRDTANYFAAIEKYRPNKKLPPIGKVEGPDKRRLRIAVFTQNPAGIEAHPDVSRAVRESAAACQRLGHHVDYIPTPFTDRVLFDFLVYYAFLSRMQLSTGRFTLHPAFKASLTEPFTKGLAEFFTRSMLHAPGSFRRLKRIVNAEHNALMAKYDVALCPTLLNPVPKLGEYAGDVPFVSLIMRINNYVNYTILQNITGAPAISLPTGRCSNGLPIGPQFFTRQGGEPTLLALAFELEQTGAFQKWVV